VNPRSPTHLATAGYLVVTILLIGFLVAGVALAVTTVVGTARGDYSITLDRFVAPQDLASLPADVHPAQDIPVTVTIHDASPTQMFLRLAINLLPLLLVTGALWQLWGLLRSARQGDPFTMANVSRLRRFGWLLLLGWPLVAYFALVLEELLAMTWSSPSDQTSNMFAPPIGGALIFGLAVLVLAEVFANGLRLREDVEGTI
jgi:Protein of unknown function (DUF2975)